MAVKYWIYSEQVNKYKDTISRGEPVELEVCDTELKTWIRASVLASQQPIDGGVPAGILNMFGDVDEESGWQIKVIEEFDDLLPEE
jgi:hypothetical protein